MEGKVFPNKQLIHNFINDKTGRLDIRAETLDRVQINIEMQLNNQGNMPRCTLFYIGKLFIESIKSGGKYENLKKTITINMVNFNLFEITRFHSTFHFYEDHEEAFMLTDAMEIHFIEYPKFRSIEKNLKDPLHRWLLFLDKKLSQEQLKELIQMDPVIKRAEERLEWLSRDEETRRLYEAREHSLIEFNSIVAEGVARGEAKGKAEGESKKIEEITVALLRKGADILFISEVTGLSVDDVEQIKKLYRL